MTEHEFYFMRHGESESNKIGVTSGSIDSPLTNKGKQQSWEIYSKKRICMFMKI